MKAFQTQDFTDRFAVLEHSLVACDKDGAPFASRVDEVVFVEFGDPFIRQCLPQVNDMWRGGISQPRPGDSGKGNVGRLDWHESVIDQSLEAVALVVVTDSVDFIGIVRRYDSG